MPLVLERARPLFKVRANVTSAQQPVSKPSDHLSNRECFAMRRVGDTAARTPEIVGSSSESG